jgi:hypothetical protein
MAEHMSWHSTHPSGVPMAEVYCGTPLGRALCRSQGAWRNNLLGFGHSHCYSERRLLGTKVSPRTRGNPYGPRREPFSSRVFLFMAICLSGGAKSDER